MQYAVDNEQTAIVSSSAVENLLPLTHHPSPINEKQITESFTPSTPLRGRASNHPIIQ
nr:hypothetical protein [uncultured Allomuricauda sp.]